MLELEWIRKPENERQYCSVKGCPLLADFRDATTKQLLCEIHAKRT